MTSEQAATAFAAAGFSNITFEQNGAGLSAKVIAQNPVPGHRAPATTGVHLIAEPPPPVPHRAITVRDWQLIAKAPDSHVGERVTVYGTVTQFDSATGPSGFRANVDGVKHSKSYDYDTNTVLRGTVPQLSNVVKDDMFRADVTVGGSYSYETTLGGTLTAPVLDINSITVIN